MFKPLKGIKVLDMTGVLAGPYSTYQLGLLGAEILKIEPFFDGDWTRKVGKNKELTEKKMGTSFLIQNSNKKSIQVNLKSIEGKEITSKLLKYVDVFVENMRPGKADKLGFGWNQVSVINKNIVYCSISAFGQDGPFRNRGAYDHVIQGMSGIMSTTGTQVQLLTNKVKGMKKGGTFVMVPPPNPYRCPPGPYERVSMIAHQFKKSNPTAKIVVLDPKKKFSKMGLFQEAWQRHYPGMIEWIGVDTHGGLKNINAATMEFETDLETFKADAASVVPAQRAGAIAMTAGLNKGDWCPIVAGSMQSQADENVYVLGDASIAKSMPKSGFSANSQAKVAANHIRGSLTGSKIFPARYSNTCWSLVATNDGVKVGASYKAGSEKIDVTSKFISKTGESSDLRKATYEESIGWYEGITSDMFS